MAQGNGVSSEPTDPLKRAARGLPPLTAEKAAAEASTDVGSGQLEDVILPAKKEAKGAWEVLSEAGAERLPFIGTAKQFDDMADLLMMARRAERGKASQRDLQVLNNWVADQERGTTGMGTFMDITLSLPKFIVEMVASAGVGKAAVSAGKFAAKETTEALIRKLAKDGALKAVRAAGSKALAAGSKKVAAGAARMAAKPLYGPLVKKELAKRAGVNLVRGAAKTAGYVGIMEVGGQIGGKITGRDDVGGIISAEAASKALGRIKWQQDEFGRFQVAMDQAIPGTLDLLPQGFVGAMIEVGSEFTGGALGYGAKSIFRKSMAKYGIEKIPLMTSLHALQMKAAERWLGKGGKNTMKRMLELAEMGQFNGIMGEFLEERAVGVGQLLAGQVSGWEQDFDGLDALFPGWADAAAELAAFSVIPAGATGVGVLGEIKRRREEAQMTPEQLLKEQVIRNQEKLGTEAGDRAVLGIQSEYQKQQQAPKPLTAEDILRLDVTYDMEGAPLTAKEIEDLVRDRAYLGGNAFKDQQKNIGHGLPGLVGEPLEGAGKSKDPATILGIQELAADVLLWEIKRDKFGQPITDKGITFLSGREQNIESAKTKGPIEQRKKFTGLAKGVAARNRVIGLVKSKNVGEMTEKMAAIIAEEHLYSQGFVTDKARKSGGVWETDRDRHTRSVLQGMAPGGVAGMGDGVAIELEAMGSRVHKNIVEQVERKIRGLQTAIRDLETGSKNKGNPKWVRLTDDLREARRERGRIKALHQLAGFQTFLRLELTADGSPHMPLTAKWFHGTYSANHSIPYQRLLTLKERITRFRTQGTAARVQAQSSDLKGPIAKWKERRRLALTPQGRRELRQLALEEFASEAFALNEFTAALELRAKEMGDELPNSESPFRMAEIIPGMARAANDEFLYRKPLDAENKQRDDVLPLVAIGRLVKGRVKLFSDLLWARRTIAAYEDAPAVYNEDGTLRYTGGAENSRKESTVSEPRETGMSYEDAQVVVKSAPKELQEAAEIYYRWWDAVLDYVAGTSRAGEKFVQRMRYRDPGDYVAIFHELGSELTLQGVQGTITKAALGVEVTKEFEGSMEAGGPIFEAIRQNSQYLFDLAFELKMREVIGDGLAKDGMTEFGVIMPADEAVVAKDTYGAAMRSLMDAYNDERQHKEVVEAREAGREPEIVERDENPFAALFAAIERGGIDPEKLMEAERDIMRPVLASVRGDTRRLLPYIDEDGNFMYIDLKNDGLVRWFNHRLTPQQASMIWSAAALHKKVFTFSTTTGRILFQMFRNPVRDVQTAVINTRTSGHAYHYFLASLNAIMSEWKRAFLGGEPINEWQNLYNTSLLGWSDELSQDSFGGRALIHRLAGKKATKIQIGWNWILDMLQAPERAVRTTELRLLAQEMLEAKGKSEIADLTYNERLELALAAKRVSTNFSVSGRSIKKWNQVIPFLNAQIQGPRDTIRAVLAEGDAERRQDKIMRGIAYYTIPALIQWLWCKDEDWYIELTPEERASSWFVPVGGEEYLMFPQAFEIGTVFSAIPILFADAAYRESPLETEWFVSRFVNAFAQGSEFVWDAVPGGVPPMLALARDMYSNNKGYWDTPIVPDSMLNLEKKAQYDEFTTRFSRFVGAAAGNLGINDGEGWSPKEIDYIIKGLGGPLALDTAEIVGGGTDAVDIGGFRSLPIVGRQFKEALAYPKSVNELYEKYNKVQRRFDTKIHPESEDEMDVRLALRDAIKAVSAINLMLRRAKGDFRSGLKKERLAIAREGLAIYRAGMLEPGQRDALRAKRKEFEKEKKALRASIIEERQQSLGD